MRYSFSLLAFCVPAAMLAQSASSRANVGTSIVIRGVTVVDVESGERRRDQAVVIQGGRIADVGPSATVPTPIGAQVVNGAGKFLIPGLWDMHVHLFNNSFGSGTHNANSYFPLLLAHGVVGVRDMWTDPDDHTTVRAWRDSVESGALIAPRVVPTSAIVDAPPPVWPNSLPVEDSAGAVRAVDSLVTRGATLIKVYSRLSRSSFLALASHASGRGVSLVGHVPGLVALRDASDAGMRSVEHLANPDAAFQAACARDGEKIRQRYVAAYFAPRVTQDSIFRLGVALVDELDAVRDLRECASSFAHLAERGTWVVPTLVVSSRSRARDSTFTRDPRLAYIWSPRREGWARIVDRALRTQKSEDFDAHARAERSALRLIVPLAQARVGLLAGTDLGNPFVYPGSSLHDELLALVQGGLSPLQALQTATINPARFLQATDSLGTISVGKLADAVMLDADPLVDIRNTARISAVIVAGRLLDQTDRERLLEKGKQAAQAGPVAQARIVPP
jgi:imidazolonepropionase-like amidohydrolase